MPDQYDRVFLDSGLLYFNPAPADTKCDGIGWDNLGCGIGAVVEFELECECGQRHRRLSCIPHFLRGLELNPFMGAWIVDLMLGAKEPVSRGES